MNNRKTSGLKKSASEILTLGGLNCAVAALLCMLAYRNRPEWLTYLFLGAGGLGIILLCVGTVLNRRHTVCYNLGKLFTRLGIIAIVLSIPAAFYWALSVSLLFIEELAAVLEWMTPSLFFGGIAIFYIGLILSRVAEKFLRCPKCRTPMVDTGKVPGLEGVTCYECPNCKHSFDSKEKNG